MKITKQHADRFAVETGDFTEGNREIRAVCRLNGTTLETVYEKGVIVFTPVRVKLGEKSFATVTALQVGESVSL